MATTITQFRKDLFQMADQALNGEKVEFVYRGVVFHVTPETKQPKLTKLIGQPVIAPDVDLEKASRELSAEMQAEWAEDWSDL